MNTCRGRRSFRVRTGKARSQDGSPAHPDHHDGAPRRSGRRGAEVLGRGEGAAQIGGTSARVRFERQERRSHEGEEPETPREQGRETCGAIGVTVARARPAAGWLGRGPPRRPIPAAYAVCCQRLLRRGWCASGPSAAPAVRRGRHDRAIKPLSSSGITPRVGFVRSLRGTDGPLIGCPARSKPTHPKLAPTCPPLPLPLTFLG